MARILLIEDDEFYRRSIATVLRSGRHSVRTSLEIREIVADCQMFDPQLAIVDWLIKEEHLGANLAYRLRNAKPNIKLLMITGFPGIVETPAFAAAQFHGVLIKPFRSAALLNAVHRLLDDSMSAAA